MQYSTWKKVMGHWSVELKQGSLSNFFLPEVKTLQPRGHSISRNSGKDCVPRHSPEAYRPCRSQRSFSSMHISVALIYPDYLSCQYVCSLSPCLFAPGLQPVPPVKILVSCPVDEADPRGGDCILLGGGLFHNYVRAPCLQNQHGWFILS